MCEFTIHEVAVKIQRNPAKVRMAENLRRAPYANPRRIGAYPPISAIFRPSAKA